MSNRKHGIERKGTKLYALAQKGLVKRCVCGRDFVVGEVALVLRPLTLIPDYCSQYCHDLRTGEKA